MPSDADPLWWDILMLNLEWFGPVLIFFCVVYVAVWFYEWKRGLR
jgi:hypothetical protein